jgi:Ca2+-transporting ATPase
MTRTPAVDGRRIREPDAEPVAWHSLDAATVLARLRATAAGLAPAEARARLLADGPNELRQAERVDALAILRQQFGSLIVWILVGAAVLSGALREWIDCAVILAIVALNAGIGFLQEYRAERALTALRRMTSANARVRRGGAAVLVPAAQVVRGDVLEVEAGDVVAADARLLAVAELQTNEAPLTGESAPVEKAVAPVAGEVPLADRRNLLFQGTGVATGSGLAVIVATGEDTELGRISGMLAAAGDEATPLQRRLAAFGRTLVWACLGVVGLVFAAGLARGEPLLDLLLTSVSLAVAAVPEGLPAVVTIALAIGVQRMARRRALVRRLHAVETLGSTDVICTDKTGTLTVGEMAVREIAIGGATLRVTGEGYGPAGGIEATGQVPPQALARLAAVMAGCNSAHLVQTDGGWSVVGDPTEGALLAAAAKCGATSARIAADMPEVLRFPFDSDRKRMSVLRRRGGSFVAFAKGAPDLLLGRCARVLAGDGEAALDAARREQVLAANAALAARGLRVLALADRELAASPLPADADAVERDLVLLGLVGIQDPPRAAAQRAVARCQAAGIRVVMITGDQPTTALAIAQVLGIARTAVEVVPGVELDRMGAEELARRAPEIAVYARVTAAHKLRIVRAHRAAGSVVAMTGDGVNDAPAIKGADIGIAMGKSGTEVTKEAADMVITDDDFGTIVDAVEQGRGVYANIRNTLQYLLAGNSGELLLFTACVAIGLPPPLLAVHLLWINLVTDGLPALCLATDPIDPAVMQARPRARGERLTNRAFLRSMAVTGVLTAGVALAVYAFTLRSGDLALARGNAFSTLVFAELLRSFGCRSDTKLATEIGLLTNLRLLAVVALSVALQLAVPHVSALAALLRMPIVPFGHCAPLLAAGAVPAVVLEAMKLAKRRQRR